MLLSEFKNSLGNLSKLSQNKKQTDKQKQQPTGVVGHKMSDPGGRSRRIRIEVQVQPQLCSKFEARLVCTKPLSKEDSVFDIVISCLLKPPKHMPSWDSA